MKLIHRQRGMTGIGWVIILLLIAFFVMIGLALIPIYLNNYKVSSVLDELKNDTEAQTMGPRHLRAALLKRLDINMVNTVEKEDIIIERIGNAMNVSIEYETRKNMFGDVDILVNYSKSVEVPIR